MIEIDKLGPPAKVRLVRIGATSRKRGRPKKLKLLPADKEIEAAMALKERALIQDPLLKILKENPNSLDVLDVLMGEMAKEAASLNFDRTEAERKGQSTVQYSSRKVTSLKYLSEVFFKKREAAINQDFDFKSKRFQRLMEWILIKVVRKSANEAKLPKEQVNILFDNIAKIFEDERWEDELLEYIKAD